jgi:TPP-dependent pyruvate/acetoin dehydrogenase alpha subunit
LVLQKSAEELNTSLYQTMRQIRVFEQMVLDEFKRGIFSGTTHTYLGQEANAAAVLAGIDGEDLVFSNHRCHGHFLAYGGDPFRLFSELMGKSSGIVKGRGGSQHIHWRNFYSNGVLGSTIPVAVGAALAEKRLGKPTITLAFMGDGALGEGVVYEAFNLASLWKAPVLFIVENNHIAQTTPTTQALAGSISGRFAAFDIPVVELDTSDVMAILPVSSSLIEQVRTGKEPRALILNTERFGPHSKSDDTRPEDMVKVLTEKRDPLTIHASRLPINLLEKINHRIEQEIRAAFNQAMWES